MSCNYVKPEIYAVEMQSVLMVGSQDAGEDFNVGGSDTPIQDGGGFNSKQRGGGISWSSLGDED